VQSPEGRPGVKGNIECRTPNIQYRTEAHFDIQRWAFEIRHFCADTGASTDFIEIHHTIFFNQTERHMYKATDIAQIFEQIAPIESGISGDELGFIYGDPETQVKGLACIWNLHAQSIAAAVRQNANMIICHEGIWSREQTSNWYEGPGSPEIHANTVRKQLLDDNQLVVYRSHSNWDALQGDGVPDQAVSALGIEGLEVEAEQKYFKVHRMPNEMSVEALSERVQEGLSFNACRVFGDRTKRIHKFAFLIGGFGENQFHMPQAARDMGAEAIIIGEMSEFIVIACLEMGLPVIESLHSASEIPAIKRQAALLSEKLTDLPVHYIPSGALSYANPSRQ
jgi:putative NIF3 family GTP cyclohydrolase 1 type 2